MLPDGSVGSARCLFLQFVLAGIILSQLVVSHNIVEMFILRVSVFLFCSARGVDYVVKLFVSRGSVAEGECSC